LKICCCRVHSPVLNHGSLVASNSADTFLSFPLFLPLRSLPFKEETSQQGLQVLSHSRGLTGILKKSTPVP